MRRLFFKGDEAANWAVMRESHAYCITSAKDEVPQQYKVTAELIGRCPSLLVVSTSGAGFDTVDVAACSKAGVLLVNQSGANADAVAEHATGMMLSLTKNIPQTDRSLRTERGVDREKFKGWNAHGRTLGIIGIGEVGRRLARICGLGLQMRVLCYDPYVGEAECQERGATKVDLATLLKQSNHVSIHCPLNAETRGMIGAAQLAMMPKGGFIVTTARGGIIDEAALHEALVSGHLGGAGVDVWNVEPPPIDHPLLKLGNVIATYHTAGVTYDSRTNMAKWNAEQIVGIFQGEKPPRLINRDAWPAYRERYAKIFGSSPVA